jgi:hypothetical protein
VFIGVSVGGMLAVALLREKLASGPTACALVRLSKEPPHILPDSGTMGRGEDDFETFRQNQMRLVKSREVLTNVLHDANVAPIFTTTPSPSFATQFLNWLFNSTPQDDPVEWLEDHIQVDFEVSPVTMRISATGNNPDESRTIVTAVRDAYLKAAISSEQDRKVKRLHELMKAEAELAERQSLLERVREEAGASTAALERELLVQELLDCKRELLRVRLARAATGRDKDASANDRALAAQEQLLRDEQKDLLAKADLLDKAKSKKLSDATKVQGGVEVLEGMAERLTAEIVRLQLELKAPQRVQAWDDVYIRNAK